MSNDPVLKIKKSFPDAVVPERAFPTDSGLDLVAHNFKKLYPVGSDTKAISLGEEVATLNIQPGERVLIDTGICATVGSGYEIQIRPRSGLALKNGLTVLNTPGTIDESYRGMIGVIIINHSGTVQAIEKGMKIAQMVVCPVTLCGVEVVEDLDSTDRDAGGFGHTGVK